MRTPHRTGPLLAALSLLCACGDPPSAGVDGGPRPDAGDASRPLPDGSAEGACPGARLLCGGACVDVASDPDHCGSCEGACGAAEACVAGACGGSASCPPETLDCGGECRDVSGDPEYCGSCERRRCGDDEVCEDGACACRPGWIRCGERCVDPRSSPWHCGGCEQVCGTVCVDGVCGALDACAEVNCDRACVDTRSDPAHCGGCGERCEVDQVCLEGGCEDYEPAPGCGRCDGCDSCPSDAFCCEVPGYGPSCLDLGAPCPAPGPSA